jgi:hypothetical protein
MLKLVITALMNTIRKNAWHSYATAQFSRRQLTALRITKHGVIIVASWAVIDDAYHLKMRCNAHGAEHNSTRNREYVQHKSRNLSRDSSAGTNFF